MNPKDRIPALKELAEIYGVSEVSKFVLDLPEFAVWSAAGKRGTHHYGKGGLQEHTYEVVSLSFQLSSKFEHNLCPRTLFLSALFHDVGKIWDYRPTNAEFTEWENTPHKKEIHHISRSAIVWSKAIASTGLHKDLEDKVLHSILSHHGLKEWGSPVSPHTREAWILHLTDCLSARMEDCDSITQLPNK